jgi:DNA adenine methylase
MTIYSPLRYPGGKTCMLELVSSIIKENRLIRPDYAEPYAGGCGLALALLYGGYVDHIHLNDIDHGIWSFWYSVLEHNSDFIELVKNIPVTVKEWHRQKRIASEENLDNPVSLGFATFFLNRTNRSGIIKRAGVIGGFEQKGRYSIDCRFNRENLARRIKRIQSYRTRIHLHRLDAIDFISKKSYFEPNTFFAIDPPYYRKGPYLYTSFYKPEDHAKVADAVRLLEHPWIITYDMTEEVRGLYRDFRQFEFDIKYSVQSKRIGTELLIASRGLQLTPEIRARRVGKRLLKAS